MVAVGDHGGDPPRRWPDDLRGPYDAPETHPQRPARRPDNGHSPWDQVPGDGGGGDGGGYPETTLRGVRGAGHQDGHSTTNQMNFSEGDPQDHLAEALLDL